MNQPQQTFLYWIDIGATAGQFTLHRRLTDRRAHQFVKEYTYIRNLGRVYEEAFERAEQWIAENHPQTFGIVKDYAPEEGGELRHPGKYDDDAFYFGKYRGELIEHVVHNDREYVCYIRDNIDRGTANMRMISFLEKLDALNLGESEQQRHYRENLERREKAESERTAKLAKNPQFGEGRHTITGTVLTTKWQEPYHPYGASTLKMLVEDDAGLRYWGTCPNSLWYDLDSSKDVRGKRVQFDATVERSRDDEYFGFIKRPTKASRI